MRYTALVLAAMLAACGTKQDKTEDSAAGRVPADSDVAAQGTGIPAGYTAITDDSSAKLTSIRYAANGASWEVTTGPAHVIFAPGDTASGTYTASATFDQLETPRHPEAYGLFVGGRDLESPNRSYTYFLVRGNGQFLVKSREGAKTKDVIAWTASPAVPRADSAGRGSYRLAVRVGAPIFAVPSVLDQAGLGTDGGLGEEGEGEGHMLESTGERIVDPRLDVFREFVNSLDVEPDSEDRQS